MMNIKIPVVKLMLTSNVVIITMLKGSKDNTFVMLNFVLFECSMLILEVNFEKMLDGISKSIFNCFRCIFELSTTCSSVQLAFKSFTFIFGLNVNRHLNKRIKIVIILKNYLCVDVFSWWHNVMMNIKIPVVKLMLTSNVVIITMLKGSKDNTFVKLNFV